MRFPGSFPALCAAVIIALAGCNSTVKKEHETRVLATVNGAPITNEDVLLRLGGHGEYLSTPLKDQTLDDIINEELLYQKGVKLGLDKDAKFQDTVRVMERKIAMYKRAEMSRRVTDTQIAATVNVTERDIKDYYGKHAEEISTDLHLGVLQFDDAIRAQETLGKIRSGTSFEEAAKGISSHRDTQMTKVKNPWDMGYLHWNQIWPEMTETVYALKKGEVSDVLTAQSGIFIVKLIERKKNPDASFDTLKSVIENRLYGIKIKEAYGRYLEQLKKESTIRKQ